MEIISLGKKIAGLVFALTIASSANANLVVNGDFEDDLLGSSVKGWGVSELYNDGDVDGWGAGNNDFIELWTESDNSFAELNAHDGSLNDKGNLAQWMLVQIISLDEGIKYDLSFDYKARQLDNESFDFRVKNSADLATWTTIANNNVDTWTTYSGEFIGGAKRQTLMFRSSNKYNDTYGNFIDNVSITVPEPATFILFGLSILGLGLRRKAKHS